MFIHPVRGYERAKMRCPGQLSWSSHGDNSRPWPDNTQIEAGVFDTQATGVSGRQTFGSPFARVPVVITAIVSDNEADAVTGRLCNIDLEGFDFRLQEQEANPQVHATESVAYIAWEPSATTIAGIRFAVGRSTNSVTSGVSTIAYAAGFARPPLLITDMQTTDGGDTAILAQ